MGNLNLRYQKFLAQRAKAEGLSEASQNDLFKKSKATHEDVMRKYRVDAAKQGKTLADYEAEIQVKNLLEAAQKNGLIKPIKKFVQVVRTQRQDFGRPEWRS